MMKNLLLFTLGLLISASMFAQRPSGRRGQQPSITGKITGSLVDTTTQEPVGFATIVLLDAETQEEKNGALSDESGDFRLDNVPPGVYDLSISFLGYENKIIQNIKLTPSKPDYDIGAINMYAEGITLAEVEVKGEAAAFENKIDKLVYNADKDISTLGGDASDVLSRVPLLAVDAEGNVSLRGSSNIQILINGKPSTIFSGNIADALRSIPAEQIKKVEVITTPTAKYDGEGSAGIINIVTKKKSAEGFTGSANLNVGNLSSSGNLSLNYARGRFGLNVNAGGWYAFPRPSRDDFLREDFLTDENGNQVTRVLDQYTEGESNYFGPRLSIGAFYDINAYNTISSSITGRGFGFNTEGETIAFFEDPLNELTQNYTRVSEASRFRSGFDWTTDYTKKFKDNPDRELSIAYQISGDFSTSQNDLLQEGDDPSLFQNFANEALGLNLENTIQTDYTHPFSEAIKMETGVKAIIRDITSDFEFQEFDPDSEDFEIVPEQTDEFKYDQDVYAGYLSFNIRFGEKWGIVAGARYEHTDIKGDYDVSEIFFENTYDNILPSFIISRDLNQFSSLKASYARRIQRPSLRFIDPYVQVTDPRDVEVGNPELLPELSNQYELAYNAYIKGVVFNAAFYYRRTTDIIERFTEVNEEGVSINTYRNIGENDVFGMNVFSSGKIGDWWTIRGGVNINTYRSEGVINGVDLSNNAIVWNGNLNSSMKFDGNWTLEINGFYRSPRPSIQGTRATYYRTSIAIQKELWDERGAIGLNISQPLNRELKFPVELEGPTFRQESERAFLARSIGVNFRYRFGKLNFKDRRPRSKIRNDDLKNDGGGGGGFGG